MPVPADRGQQSPAEQRVLGRHLAGKTPGQAENCINARRPHRLIVASDATLLFRVSGSLVYRNDLAERCPGLALSPFQPSFNSRGSSICRGDVITVERGTQAACALGPFVPYTRAPR